MFSRGSVAKDGQGVVESVGWLVVEVGVLVACAPMWIIGFDSLLEKK